MTTVSIICMFFICGFLSGNALLYWSLWLSFFCFVGLVCPLYGLCVERYHFNTHYGKEPKDETLKELWLKWKDGDWKSERLYKWLKIPFEKRLDMVHDFKERRLVYIDEYLSICKSKERKRELERELEAIDNFYNVDVPPREWKHKVG